MDYGPACALSLMAVICMQGGGHLAGIYALSDCITNVFASLGVQQADTCTQLLLDCITCVSVWAPS
jgi:hypothetical protein